MVLVLSFSLALREAGLSWGCACSLTKSLCSGMSFGLPPKTLAQEGLLETQDQDRTLIKAIKCSYWVWCWSWTCIRLGQILCGANFASVIPMYHLSKISQAKWLKQQRFISYSSGVWEVQDKGASKKNFILGPVPLASLVLSRWSPSHCAHVRRVNQLFNLFSLGYQSHSEGPTFKTSSKANYLPKAPSLSMITFLLQGCNTKILEGH